MQNKIDIGTTIDLQDLLQSRLLIQGNSGAGKSVLARVIIEQTFGIVPFIVLDIEGEYYTLKEKFGDILVIGGQHADIPINMQSGKLLQELQKQEWAHWQDYLIPADHSVLICQH
jgi:hypothetical protein